MAKSSISEILTAAYREQHSKVGNRFNKWDLLIMHPDLYRKFVGEHTMQAGVERLRVDEVYQFMDCRIMKSYDLEEDGFIFAATKFV